MLYRIFATAVVLMTATIAQAGLSISTTPSVIPTGSGTTNVTVSLRVDGTGLTSGMVDTIDEFTVSVTGPGLAFSSPTSSLVASSPWFQIPIPGNPTSIVRGGGETAGPETFMTFNVAVPDTADAVFDVVVSDAVLQSRGVFATTVNGTIGQIVVGVAVPEPSSFLFMGLVGTGLIGFQHYRKRRQGDEAEEVEVAEVA